MKRIAIFDYARTIAILCVVLSHTALAYTYNPSEIQIDIFIHNLVGIGVPLFLFMAGYFATGKTGQTFITFMREKFSRIYLPSVLWTILFSLVVSFGSDRSQLNLQEFISNVTFLSNPTFYYFTFVIILLFIWGYFLFRVRDGNLLTITRMSFTVNLGIIAIYEIALWATPKGGILPGVAMYRNPFAWIFFFTYGVYIGRSNKDLTQGWFLRFSQNRVFYVGLMALLLVITSLESGSLYERMLPGAQDYFKVASFIFEIIAIHYVFIFLRGFHPTGVVDDTFRLIAKYSFFIYLVHMPTVEKLLGTSRLISLSHYHYLAIIIVSGLCFLVPLAIAYIVKLLSIIPVVKANMRYIGLPAP